MTSTLKWRQGLPAPGELPGADEIHLWRTDLDEASADSEVLFRALSFSEQERARRFILESHRRRFLAARAFLRSVLGACLDLPPSAVPLATNAHGKPCIAAEANHAGLQFNLSHSGRLALLAVAAGKEVGVDLQDTLPDAAWSWRGT